MYKKILALVSIFLLAIVSSGCAKYSTKIEITNKDEVIISQQYGIDKKILEMCNSGFDSDTLFKKIDSEKNNKDIEKLKKNNYEVSNLKNNYIGKRLYREYRKANYITIDDLPLGIAAPTGTTNPIYIKKGIFGTKYIINLQLDTKKISSNKKTYIKKINQELKKNTKQISNSPIDENQAEQPKNLSLEDAIQSVQGQDEFKPITELTIKIPKKAKKHNATSVDEKKHEYKWTFNPDDINTGKLINVNLEFSKTNFLSIIFLLLLLYFTINVVVKNKQYEKDENDETKDAF